MKKIFALLLVLTSLNSFAANATINTTANLKNNYLISASLYINDKKINSASFGVTEGGKGSVEMKENFIDVTSIKPDTTVSANGVKMSFEVGNFTDNGERKVVATYTVVTDENKMATLMIASNNGEDTYKIEMTPKKLTR
jgi:hypothetical protein